MVIHWLYLLLGILMLWFPRQWMRMGKHIRLKKRRSARVDAWSDREPGDPRIGFAREFRKPRNYFDLLRGAAGGIAVMGWGAIPASLGAGPNASGREALTIHVIQLVIMLGGLIAQTIRTEHRRISFFAPIFFLGGLSLPLLGGWAAFFAFALVWGANPMLQNAQAFLSLYSVLMLAFGLFFNGLQDLDSVAAGLLCFLPTLLSMMTRRPLLVFSRRGFHGS